jgi:hypothetical protein
MDENFVLTVTSGYGDPAVATWGIVVGRPPTILSFTESASVVAAGGSVDLTWDIGELGDGSASLSVDGGTPSPVSATGTASSGVLALGLHTFVLSAENEYGSPSQTLYCVAGVAPYVSLSGDSPVGTYASGTSIVLDWSVSGSSSITLNGGSVSATGSASEVLTGSPGSNVTFSMVAVNEYGSETQTLTYTISSGGGYEFPILHVVVDGSDVDVGSVVAELS